MEKEHAFGPRVWRYLAGSCALVAFGVILLLLTMPSSGPGLIMVLPLAIDAVYRIVGLILLIAGSIAALTECFQRGRAEVLLIGICLILVGMSVVSGHSSLALMAGFIALLAWGITQWLTSKKNLPRAAETPETAKP